MILQNQDHNTIDYIEGVANVVERYDVFLVDVWGVLHDSVKPYPGVIDCLRQLKNHLKTIILISNTARRAYLLEEQLAGFGILPGMYDHLVTSGELTRGAFASGSDTRLADLGKAYYLMGSEGYGLTEGLPLERTQELKNGDFVLAISVSGNPQSTAAAENELQIAAEIGLVMVCANPDQLVNRGGELGIGPGALAARYEELGGRVIYFGKPYPEIYRFCLESCARCDPERVAAVGDSLKTDVAGANSSGIDSILVAGGIHAHELTDIPSDTSRLMNLCEREKSYPTMLVKGFYWEGSRMRGGN